MKGYSKETGLPHVPPQKSERKKKDPADKRYTKSFRLSAEAIAFLDEKEEELGRGKISRYVDDLILAEKKVK